ncbi:MAG: NADH-quinone oxidoreductase subunit NuoK [Chloroflexi bacterium]|nr:NADH-quinone oxidoreductase subunit NuoK [Chloroflexota bacterium]
MIPVEYYVILSAILFVIGALGVLIRRNPLIIFMSIELMLNAANLVFVAYGRTYQIAAEIAKQKPIFDGQIFVFFVIAVAAAEVAVGLALIVEIFKAKKNINIDELNSLKG